MSTYKIDFDQIEDTEYTETYEGWACPACGTHNYNDCPDEVFIKDEEEGLECPQCGAVFEHEPGVEEVVEAIIDEDDYEDEQD